MKPVIPYLFFNGNCREAMDFYKGCFGGTLELMTYADAPEDAQRPGADKNKIMHGCLTKRDFSLMASDNPMAAPAVGDNISLYVPCETVADTEKLFAALGKGGQVTMPLADTFWGAHFGMLTDRFGIHWMLSGPLKG